MSAPVDVLAVMDNAQALVFEPGKRGEEWAALIAQSRAAVAELIAASSQDLWSTDKATRIAARLRWDAALARCKGGTPD